METNISVKFHKLLNSLLYTKMEFEIVADEIGDSRLRTALNGFSEESELYINELRSHLHLLGFEFQSQQSVPENLIDPATNNIVENNGNELQYICNNSEKFITATYSDILDSSFPFPVIREIMIYQLQTLRSILSKINFLNVSRFAV